MEEVWKDIYFIQDGIEWDYRGLYQVSNLGRVKRLFSNKTKKERILKLKENNCGYLNISLCKNGICKQFYVHRLIAYMFIENDDIESKKEINHKDENKKNNIVDNLEWCTRKENCNYGTRTKRSREPMKGKNNPYAKKITQYDLDGNLIKIWDCMMDIERNLKIKSGNISNCCQGRQKTAGGYIWRYYEED